MLIIIILSRVFICLSVLSLILLLDTQEKIKKAKKVEFNERLDNIEAFYISSVILNICFAFFFTIFELLDKYLLYY